MTIEDKNIEIAKMLGKSNYLDFHSDYNLLMEAIIFIERLSYRKGRYYSCNITSSSVEIVVDRMNVRPFSKWGATNNKGKAIFAAVSEFAIQFNKKEIV